MLNVEEEKPARVLDPVERVSEVIFGLLMAMTFVGALERGDSWQRGCAYDDDHGSWVQPRLGACGRGNVPRADRDGGTRASSSCSHDCAAGRRQSRGRGFIAEALPLALLAAAGTEGARNDPPPPRRDAARAEGRIAPWLRRLQRRTRRFLVGCPGNVPGRSAVHGSRTRPCSPCACPTWSLSGCSSCRAQFSRGTRAEAWWGGTAMAVTGALLMAAIMALGG